MLNIGCILAWAKVFRNAIHQLHIADRQNISWVVEGSNLDLQLETTYNDMACKIPVDFCGYS